MFNDYDGSFLQSPFLPFRFFFFPFLKRVGKDMACCIDESSVLTHFIVGLLLQFCASVADLAGDIPSLGNKTP